MEIKMKINRRGKIRIDNIIKFINIFNIQYYIKRKKYIYSLFIYIKNKIVYFKETLE